MPVRKKLGFVRKMLAKVGRRLIWSTSKKINRLILHATWKECILTFAWLVHNDEAEAIRLWYEVGRGAGEDLMYEWLGLVKLFFSKSLKDMKLIVKTAWYAYLGEFPDKVEYFEAGDGHEVPRVVWHFNKCWICAQCHRDEDLDQIDFKKFGEYGYASCASGIFETALQMIQDRVENPYSVQVRETKCFMRGDDRQEFTAFFYPKEA